MFPLEDLNRVPDVVRDLLSQAVYRKMIDNRLMVMIGYSHCDY